MCQFHALWVNDDSYTPTAIERSLAREGINKYSAPRAEKLLPRVVEIMRTHFPKAKSFGATRRYWPDAVNSIQHEQAVADRKKKGFIDQEIEGAKAQGGPGAWQAQWERLSPDEQEVIRQIVLNSNSPLLRLEKHPAILHRFCLKELGKREHLSKVA